MGVEKFASIALSMLSFKCVVFSLVVNVPIGSGGSIVISFFAHFSMLSLMHNERGFEIPDSRADEFVAGLQRSS